MFRPNARLRLLWINSSEGLFCGVQIRWKIAQNAELLWWKRYLKDKNHDSYLTWKKEYWTQFLERCKIRPEPHQQILDIGCGPAGIFLNMPKDACTAVDPLMDQYMEEFPWLVNYPDATLQKGRLEGFETSDKFDLIFCLNAVNHVADWDSAMMALWHALKPGGTLILSSDVHRFPLLKYPFRLIQGDILHPQQHDLKDYLKFFTNHYGKDALQQSTLYKVDGLFLYYVFQLKKS
ncbi:MAG: class I SAM-dependent methyltransferase [Bacteroidetes bacterium]|nr:MAG: class I SAM-dependent methyltransferase [Bacteroidota bacterium]